MPQIFSVGARSIFVNTVAWAGILLAMLSVISSLIHRSSGQLLRDFPAPQSLAYLFDDHLPLLVACVAVLSLATLVAAIGLLLRLNWARIVFIGLLIFAILANLAGLWLQQQVVQTVVSHTLASTALPEQALSALGGLATASKILGVFMTAGLCAVLVWIIIRLMSQPVRQEFV